VTTPGRELAYQNWSQKELARALIQAEDEIKDLEALLHEAAEERGRFYQESRESAQVLGGILLLLGHNACWPGAEEPDDAPNLQRLGDRHRTRARHVKARASEGMGNDSCVCGAPWLATECSAAYDALVAKERAERSSWSPPSFPGGGR
jgi:hypothetical protein